MILSLLVDVVLLAAVMSEAGFRMVVEFSNVEVGICETLDWISTSTIYRMPTARACSSAWYELRTKGPDAACLKPIW